MSYLTHLVDPRHHLLPGPWQAAARMSVAHAAAPDDPLPDTVVMEAGVGDPDLWEEVDHDSSDVGDCLIALGLLFVERGVFRRGKGHLWKSMREEKVTSKMVDMESS